MKRSLLILVTLIVCFSLAFIGCASRTEYSDNYGSPSYDSSETWNSSPKEDAYATFEPADPASPDSVMTGRKVIRNAELRIETLEFDTLLNTLNGKIAVLGGYIQNNSVNGRAYGSSKTLRTANMVVRIPADKLDEFLAALDGLGNVLSLRENVDDVTENYVDIEARLASLRTEYDTLLGLLSRAETLEEIITLQDRLSDVRYEIESYEARIRSYDSLIAYSTVTLTINEVERETVAEEESFGQEVSRRFSESLEDVGEGFKDFAAWFIGNLPTILVLLVFFVGLPLMIVLICVKSAKKRRAKRAAKAAAAVENK